MGAWMTAWIAAALVEILGKERRRALTAATLILGKSCRCKTIEDMQFKTEQHHTSLEKFMRFRVVVT